VQTNIVNCFVDRFGGDATAIAGALGQLGVLANGERNRIRFVTHAPVDEAAVEAVAAVILGGRGDSIRQKVPMTEGRADEAEVVR
jgi:threonine aldolase